MEDMYKQAILDAKAVRASAMANAKATLQEAFEPKIQEMIRLKLSEELEEDENDPYSVEVSDTDMGTQDESTTDESLAEDQQEFDEASLEEILAELEELAAKDEEDEGKIMEAEDEETEDDSEEEDSEDDSEEESDDDSEESEDDDTETSEEAPADDTKVIDITLGDLKQVLQSIQGGDMGSEGGDTESEGGEEAKEDSDETIDMEEILSSLEEAKNKEMKKKDMKEKKEDEETKKNLKEAVKTINILRKELNEVNLLNAKLLYMNKIFKSKNLSESQKVNVVSALDRASNTKEAKNIYETLKENISQKKSQIQESRGFASNPAGVAPKKPILESDAFVSRWQKIAGIK